MVALSIVTEHTPVEAELPLDAADGRFIALEVGQTVLLFTRQRLLHLMRAAMGLIARTEATYPDSTLDEDLVYLNAIQDALDADEVPYFHCWDQGDNDDDDDTFTINN